MRIAFVSGEELIPGGNPARNREIFTFDLAANSFSQVTDTPGFLGPNDSNLPSINADGTRISFVSTADLVPGRNSDRLFEVFLFDAPTGVFTQLSDTRDFRRSEDPSISGDGTRIAFRSTEDLVPGLNPDGSFEIFLFDTTAGVLSQLTDLSTRPFRGPRGPSISADGNCVAFASFGIFVLDLAISTLTQVTPAGFSPSISGDGNWIAFQSAGDLVPGGNPDGSREVFLVSVAGCGCGTGDEDGDGVPDDVDECPGSDLSRTVVVDGCDSGVVNTLFDTGCTISDLIFQCAEDAGNHGGFASCVADLTNRFKTDGLISGKEKGAIQRCAARARIP